MRSKRPKFYGATRIAAESVGTNTTERTDGRRVDRCDGSGCRAFADKRHGMHAAFIVEHAMLPSVRIQAQVFTDTWVCVICCVPSVCGDACNKHTCFFVPRRDAPATRREVELQKRKDEVWSNNPLYTGRKVRQSFFVVVGYGCLRGPFTEHPKKIDAHVTVHACPPVPLPARRRRGTSLPLWSLLTTTRRIASEQYFRRVRLYIVLARQRSSCGGVRAAWLWMWCAALGFISF